LERPVQFSNLLVYLLPSSLSSLIVSNASFAIDLPKILPRPLRKGQPAFFSSLLTWSPDSVGEPVGPTLSDTSEDELPTILENSLFVDKGV
jgi:hypothetical protein